MAQTILEIVRNALLLAGFEAPRSLLTPSTHYDIEHYKAIFESVGRDLASKYSWPSLLKTYSFQTVASQDSYSLPGDCSRVVSNTPYNNADSDWLFGPLSIEDFALDQFDPLLAGTTYKFSLQGINRIVITPTPAEAITLKLKYLSTNWVVPKEWTASTYYTANSYVRYLDNIYTNVSEGTSGDTPPIHVSGSESDGGISWVFYNAPYIKIINDEDLVAVDEQALESGIISRLKETLEQPNQLDEARYRQLGALGYGHKKVSKTLSLFGKSPRYRNPKIVGF